MKEQSLHLIAHKLCPYVQRSIITLEEKNILYSRTDIDLANKPVWFTQQSPTGKVPVLLVDKTHTLFESHVICEYLDEITPGSLHPSDPLKKALHRAWIEFGSSILSNIARLYNAKEASDFQVNHVEMKRKFRLLENQLNDDKFFTGARFHLIDAVYGPIFRYFDVFDTLVDLEIFNDLPQCTRWRNALAQRDSIQKAVCKDYSDRLAVFLFNRGGYLSEIMREKSGRKANITSVITTH